MNMAHRKDCSTNPECDDPLLVDLEEPLDFAVLHKNKTGDLRSPVLGHGIETPLHRLRLQCRPQSAKQISHLLVVLRLAFLTTIDSVDHRLTHLRNAHAIDV